MALLRRYGFYAALAVLFLYMFYSLSFPYESADSPGPGYNGKPQKPTKQFNWEYVKLQNPIQALTPLPTGDPKPLPRIQHKFDQEEANAKNIRNKRREEVRNTFLKSWRSYRQKAWMHDELKPISGGHENPFGGWAATLIDALDTLWIMGFKEEFRSALKDIQHINFGATRLEKVNVFETNIRHLGGLLSAYELSKEEILLTKAKEVGEMLYHAFDTPNHMPKTRWNFNAAGSGKKQVADEAVLLAEIGSMTMEFTRLSQITKNPKYYDAVHRVAKNLQDQQDRTKLPGMWPIVVNAQSKNFAEDNTFTIASMADSAYEYLSKTYAMLGGLQPMYKSMYEKAMRTAIKTTLYRPMTPDNSDMLMSGIVRVEDSAITLQPEMQHLVCYAGGMFALGGKIFGIDEHIKIGRKITDTCVWAYKSSPAGIMPEVSHLHKCPSIANCSWNEQTWEEEVKARADLTKEKDPQQNIANLRLPKGFTSIDDRRYILRPEAIESVFIMYRITGEQSWQAAAWDMFTAINQATQTEHGNAALLDVSTDNPPKMDSQESFWMAETLKYFYLTFSDPNVISLDDYVFNTEAHPFRIPKPKN